MSHDLDVPTLHQMLARLQEGDAAAVDELIRQTSGRLERMARHMLRGFPLVRAHEWASDVLQNALVRLAKALPEVKPATPAHYFHLAGEQIRRELLDLARHHRRRAGVNEPASPDEPPKVGTPNAEDIDRWQALHEAVESLPALPREVFGLTYYHGWTQAQIAELFHISDRHVRRILRDACARLKELLGDDFPTT